VPSIAAFYVDPAEREALLARLRNGEGAVTGDLRYRRRDGAVRWLRLTLSFVRDPGGELLGMLAEHGGWDALVVLGLSLSESD
jgi:PAS domain-containing protein